MSTELGHVANGASLTTVPRGQTPPDVRPAAGKLGDDEVELMDMRDSTVRGLARQYTRDSTRDPLDDSHSRPIFGSNDVDSPLNPLGENFNARAWAQNIARVANDRGQRPRTLGLCFQSLNVFGYGTPTDFQKDVGNIWLALPAMARGLLSSKAGQTRVNILRGFDGIIRTGEMCAVLGPPGSGCSTFLKTIAGETNGIYVKEGSCFNYQGISPKEMHKDHFGDAIYTAEVDVHFPQLTAADTLTFASRARCPRDLPHELDRNQYCDHYRDVVMAMYGISHTLNTKVGDNFTRGVSGGERKRVSIAEATLSGAPFQCWDNSTRGLDSANAIEFCKTLKLQSEVFGQTCAVSMYQAPQQAYDQFDKVLVLYEGHQIYFGPASKAKEYFVDLGFDCPSRQTTPDFVTSMTFSAERRTRAGCNPPRTAEEFVVAWKKSPEHEALQAEIEEYKQQHPINGPDAETFRSLKQLHQAKGQSHTSPYTLTYHQQVRLCFWRGWKRFKAAPEMAVGMMIGNTIMALILSSLFYNLRPDTESFYGRTVVLFVALVFSAFSSILEIMTLYQQRPIVDKQSRYAFYHPSAEAYASVLVDIPLKVLNIVSFNLVFYFMTNLYRAPGPFFFYLLTMLLLIMAMSGVFRAIAATSRTEGQAMTPASVIMLALIIFTGFVIPVNYMLPWCRWINYINPVGYGYEALVINEFYGRSFACSSHVPDYASPGSPSVACDVIGAVPGELSVSGEAYINSAYSYYHAHKWRNVGIVFAMAIFFHVVYFVATEYITAKKSKGEVLVFRRGFVPKIATKGGNDVEKSAVTGPAAIVAKTEGSISSSEGAFNGSTGIFHWHDVCYDITVKKQPRRILDKVDGWVKPGTLTALMGVSGAGKTTLLDCLADRRGGVGVITGEMLVDGRLRDESFQRKTGYAQQQDLHAETSTVREALTFSALLRQPAKTPRAEKIAYVNEVIKLLDMEEYADAVVGVLGEGLNVEQRKRLTIGVELAAKPPLLLFVDEPTSGLDSQTSWAILSLLERLSKAGQSILCTIHQPSAMLFQRFDRLLLLAEGGRTVYFGDIGENSSTLTGFLERHGAPACPPGANPAEWMLEAIGAAPGSHSEVDWHNTWLTSPEYQAVQEELGRLRNVAKERPAGHHEGEDLASYREFAAPLWSQFLIVTQRTFQQSWRTPSYIYSKLVLSIGTSLFVGLVFLNAPLTIQGLRNQMLAIFELSFIFSQLINQQLPQFVLQRNLYEVRERPAKTYSWKVFMLSQIVSEIPWNTLASVFMFILIWFPVGFYKNAADAGQSVERAGLMWLLCWQFLLMCSTFGHMCISFVDTEDAGANVANLLFMLMFFFCGVLAPADAMPRFWIFLFRVSPLAYWVSAILSTGIANVEVHCADNEWTSISPPPAAAVGGLMTCGEYMGPYIERAGGYLRDAGAVQSCDYCKIRETNVFLAGLGSRWEDAWRNFGLLWVYIAFNIAAAMFLYWLARMPKKSKNKL